MNVLNLGNLSIITNCDECETSFAMIYCQQCEQHMCEKCDKKIHNKGKRATHLRETIPDKEKSSEKKFVEKSPSKMTMPQHVPLEWEIQCRNINSQMIQLLQQIKSNCVSGTIVYSHEQLSKLFEEARLKHDPDLINKCVEKGWVLKTTRIFNEEQKHFYSLNIKVLTYETLVWVIVSIKKDLITPTERLVQSRIKECFGIKLTKSDWESILIQISKNKGPCKFRNSQGRLVSMPILIVKQVRDPMIGEESPGIYIADTPWPVEDEYSGQITDLEQRPEWLQFTKFLDDFFAKSKEKKTTLTGGRYGCAQYIKFFGPKLLQDLSLGRLTLFVQMAVNKSIIRYNKTFLIKNQQESYFDVKSIDNSVEQENKVKFIRQAIVELLLENADGYLIFTSLSVSLAQIPQFLKPKVHFEINFNELGFPKLKNFVEAMKDIIELENCGKNNSVARIIPSKLPPKLLQEFEAKRRARDMWLQKYGQEPNINSDRTHYYRNYNNSHPHHNRSHRQQMSILMRIQEILRENCYGISVTDLYNQLSNLLGEWFQFQQFGCVTFLQFLQQFADQMIVIVCQKDEFWIYEKDFRFKPPHLHNSIDNHMMSKSMYTHSTQLNDNQFEEILNEAFPNQFGVPVQQIYTPRQTQTPAHLFIDSKSSNVSWLDRPEQYSTPSHIKSSLLGSHIPLNQNSRILPSRNQYFQQPEDSNLDIHENLRFIEELLEGNACISDTEMTQNQEQYEWSASLNQQIGMISSIDIKHSKAQSEDFDLNKALEDKDRRTTQTDKSVKRHF